MAEKSETALAEKVVEWLLDQHWEVYQEVQFDGYGRIADIVAVFEKKIMWIVECKTSMTLAVMEQASRWQSHYRSIAVPTSRNPNGRFLGHRICRDYLNIGVLEVGIDVEEIVKAPLQRHNHDDYLKRRYFANLLEGQKTYAKAGNNHGSRYTPYRQTILAARDFISKNPGCTLKQLFEGIETHYPSKSAKSQLRQALFNWEGNWCEVKHENNTSTFYIKPDAWEVV